MTQSAATIQHPPICVGPDDQGDPHLDRHGTCDCSCGSCTVDHTTWVQCICPDCDPAECGMHGTLGSETP